VFERCPVTIRRGKSQAPPQPERSQTWPRLVSYRARRREVRGRFLRALVLRVSFSKVANSARTEDGNRGGLGARLALDVIPGNAGCPILPTIGPSRGAVPILAPTDRVGH
jgi:hypothetical protein